MVLDIIIAQIKKEAESVGAGITMYYNIQMMTFASEAIKFALSIISPIIVAYLVHVLKKNYWEPERPFFKNVVEDLKKLWKK